MSVNRGVWVRRGVGTRTEYQNPGSKESSNSTQNVLEESLWQASAFHVDKVALTVWPAHTLLP